MRSTLPCATLRARRRSLRTAVGEKPPPNIFYFSGCATPIPNSFSSRGVEKAAPAATKLSGMMDPLAVPTPASKEDPQERCTRQVLIGFALGLVLFAGWFATRLSVDADAVSSERVS